MDLIGHHTVETPAAQMMRNIGHLQMATPGTQQAKNSMGAEEVCLEWQGISSRMSEMQEYTILYYM